MGKMNEAIIGHRSVLEALEQDIATDNVSHAYLFSGAASLGKMTVAHWFARTLLLRNAADPKQALTELERLTHPDLLVMDQLWMEEVCDDWDVISRSSNVPQMHRSKKPAAKTDTISIDDIRALQERLYEKGTGTYRCCIIRKMERMQAAATNAFLKILEEPPPGLVFLLTTEAENELLPTILSRVRTLHLHRVQMKELTPLLKGMDDTDAGFVAQIAQGAPGVLMRLRDDPDALREQKMLAAQAHGFWAEGKLLARMKGLAPLAERGREADSFLMHLFLAARERGVHQTYYKPLLELAKDLQTNANRELLCQRFALACTAT